MILVNSSNYNGRIGFVANGGKIVGDFTFQKWITRCDGYSSYGSPFTALKTDFNWYYCYQCMGSGWSNLHYYNESVQGTLDLGYYDNIGSSLTRGKGFFYWFSNYNGGQNFDRKISLKGSVDLTATFDFDISRTTSAGSSNDGWNLISNPFPGTIDWLAGSGAWTKKKVNTAIYVWSSCSNSYASYVGGVGVNGGSRYIPSMQGFWVQANGNNPKLQVDNNALVNNSRSLLKTKSTTDTVNYVLRLKLNNDEIAIRLDSNSTSELDSLTDARKFLTDSSKIYSCINSSFGSDDYAVNSVKDSSNIIPIKIKGSGILNFSGINTFFGQYAIYLKDLVNNQYLSISEGMQYVFSDTSTITFNKRFEIHFIKNSVVGIKAYLDTFCKITYNQENIFISIPKEVQLPVTIKMVDLLGREVYSRIINERELIIQKNDVPVIITIFNHQERFVKKIF